MLWLRALIFSVLVPGTIGFVIPLFLLPFKDINCSPWSDPIGNTLLIAATLIYLWSVLAFVVQGKGTPAIWFTNKLRFLIGEEPKKAVTQGLYRISRNPMYLSICIFIVGLGYRFENLWLFIYALLVFLFFHCTVVYLEEPHLKKKFGDNFLSYMKTTRRWL